MRALLIGLLLVSLLLIGNIVAIVVSAEYKAQVQTLFRSSSGSSTSNLSDIPPDEMAKLSTSLDRLAVGLDALTSTGGSITSVISPRSTSSGATSVEVPPQKVTYQIPASLLTRLMPDIFLKEQNIDGVLGLYIYTNVAQTTYTDVKSKLNVYVFRESYPVMLSNLRLASGVYTINETDTFFQASFFLNAVNKKDTTIRILTSVEGKAVALEFPKTLYPKIKKLLTKK